MRTRRLPRASPASGEALRVRIIRRLVGDRGGLERWALLDGLKRSSDEGTHDSRLPWSGGRRFKAALAMAMVTPRDRLGSRVIDCRTGSRLRGFRDVLRGGGGGVRCG